MKIRKQFIISMAVFGLILFIIATSVIITNQHVERLNTQEEVAKNIEREANELSYLSNDYLLYHESQQRARWESKFSSLSNDLSSLNPNSPEQQTLVNNIRANQQRLKAVFADAVSILENTSQNQGAVSDPAVIQTSWSRMAVQNQGMTFDAERLSQILHDQADQLKQTNITLILALLGILGLYFLTNYLIVYRRALKSISELQEGTRIIGSGNFDFAIKQRNDDEIGELSHAFNRMTANLKDVTASKTEMEREITERKRAENALRESEERWATTLASIGDAVISTDVEGRITFMNSVAEALTGWTLAEASTKHVTEVFNIINEYTRAEADNPVTRVLQEGTIVGLANHTILVRKDGTEVPIDDSGAPIRDRDGKTMGVVLVFRDITERKRAEKKIEHLASFPQLNPNPVIEIDANGTVKFSNVATAEVLKTLEIEDDVRTFLPGDFEEIMKALEQGKEIQTFYREVEVKDRIFAESIYVSKKLSAARIYVHDITKRKRAEDDIKRNEARLESLLRISQHRAGSIQELLDFALDEAIALTGSKIGYIYHYDDTKKEFTLNTWSKDVMKQCTIAEQQTIYQLEKTGIWGEAVRQARPIIVNDYQAPHPQKKGYPDGHAPLYKYMTVPVFSDGHIVGVVGVANKEADYDIADMRQLTLLMDSVWKITDRKQAEEALRESEKRYRSLFENMMDGFAYCKMLFDDDGCPADFVYLDVNSAFGRLTGLENVVGKKVTEAIPGIKESNPELFEIYGRLALAGQPETFEIEFKPLGAWLSISVYSPERGYFVAVFDNITERKQAEEALRRAHDELEIRVQERTAELQETNNSLLESETRYRELSESIDDLFFAMDRELRYTYWNKASEAFTGISAKDAIEKSLYELFPDVKGTKVEQFYVEALKTQQHKRFESEYQLGDKKFIFEINAYPTKTGLSVIAKDITEKKKLESQLLRAQRMESIGTLAGGIAHDLNNMLTPMMLSLHMLKEKFKDEQSQKLLTILEKNSQRGADLIKQVLSFARGVDGERNPIQAKHIITEIEKVAKETFPRNIEIRTDIQKDLFTISGDATQLHQVIMNLCVNARDAMPDGGVLSISAENFFVDENYALMHTEAKVGSYITIAVSDNGIGIPPKILDRIFEPFFTTKEFGKGTGLGLSTALAIMKSHGGFINVYSEVGKGTTFRVYLPAIKTEMRNVEEQQLELLIGHGELVLVVEDEAPVREITISTLETFGYKVLTADDGVGAVELYVKNKDKIKVILMDMMMPVMDGHASIRAIRRINHEIKIIAVSGLAEKDRLANIADHTNAFLPKPYNAEKLLKTIHEVLSTK